MLQQKIRDVKDIRCSLKSAFGFAVAARGSTSFADGGTPASTSTSWFRAHAK
jgi:hypothetical protein